MGLFPCLMDEWDTKTIEWDTKKLKKTGGFFIFESSKNHLLLYDEKLLYF
jgi:hypothetical protein